LVVVPFVLAFGVAGLAIVLAEGDDSDEGAAGTEPPQAPVAIPEEDLPEKGSAEGGTAAAPDEKKQAARAVRDYVSAIDERDGGRVCSTLAPGAIENFPLPRERGGCAASLGASIGYRDPRGYPVFDSARLESIGDVAVGAGEARVTATIVTGFADRDEPSIEDDLIYLVESEGEWRIARPSSTLYRAVGKAEVPPQAIAPPG
jgi:ketosteroid isomerase-like protein